MGRSDSGSSDHSANWKLCKPDTVFASRVVTYTVKLVYKHHPREQENVVLIYTWSLYAGCITWKVYPWGPANCAL